MRTNSLILIVAILMCGWAVLMPPQLGISQTEQSPLVIGNVPTSNRLKDSLQQVFDQQLAEVKEGILKTGKKQRASVKKIKETEELLKRKQHEKSAITPSDSITSLPCDTVFIEKPLPKKVPWIKRIFK